MKDHAGFERNVNIAKKTKNVSFAPVGREGNAYLMKDFPKLDFIITARIVSEWKP